MGLAVALDLGPFVERLPLAALFDIGLVDRLAGILRLDREHQPVGEIAVMRDGKRGPAGLALVAFQPGIEIERVGRADRRLRDHRYDLQRARRAVTQKHVAVQVVALDERGPFIADDRREPARLVVFLRGLDHLFPHGIVDLRPRRVIVDDALRQGLLSKSGDRVDRSRGGFLSTGLHAFVPGLSFRIGEDVGCTPGDILGKAHQVRMVGDHQPIERTGELDRLVGRRCDLLATREAVGLFQPERVAEQPGIGRKPRVQMGIAPVDMARKTALRIGRIGSAVEDVGQRFLGRYDLRHGGTDTEKKTATAIETTYFSFRCFMIGFSRTAIKYYPNCFTFNTSTTNPSTPDRSEFTICRICRLTVTEIAILKYIADRETDLAP